MAYIKGGIVTRIEEVKSRKKNYGIENVFDLSLFKKEKNYFLLDKDILNNNLCDFRNEFLSLTNFNGDSMDCCEAYSLEISVDEMLKNDIYLTYDNKRFFFKNYENFKFETDYFWYKDDKISFGVYFIPIFWDINRVEAENFNIITNFVNNLTRKALINELKGACWFSVI